MTISFDFWWRRWTFGWIGPEKCPCCNGYKAAVHIGPAGFVLEWGGSPPPPDMLFMSVVGDPANFGFVPDPRPRVPEPSVN